MFVSNHEKENGHLFTYVKGDEIDGEVLAGITSYSSGSHFYPHELDHDVSEKVKRSRYSRDLDSDIETYPLESETFEDVAEGVRNVRLPLTAEQVKKKLGEMTDSQKAKKKWDFFY
jgi:hypothetical protein